MSDQTPGSEVAMMAEQQAKPLNRRQVLALRGLRLPSSALKAMRKSGILCDPGVSIVWQKEPDVYLIRGRESGGAAGQIGAYCGFVGEHGEPLEFAERLDNVGRNGFHALVFAPRFVRVQIFRNLASYDLLITRHRLMARKGKKRPLLENAILFHGVRGHLVDPVSSNSDDSAGDVFAIFDDGFGNSITVPQAFRSTVAVAVLGSRCVGCKHCHLLG